MYQVKLVFTHNAWCVTHTPMQPHLFLRPHPAIWCLAGHPTWPQTPSSIVDAAPSTWGHSLGHTSQLHWQTPCSPLWRRQQGGVGHRVCVCVDRVNKLAWGNACYLNLLHYHSWTLSVPTQPQVSHSLISLISLHDVPRTTLCHSISEPRLTHTLIMRYTRSGWTYYGTGDCEIFATLWCDIINSAGIINRMPVLHSQVQPTLETWQTCT